MRAYENPAVLPANDFPANRFPADAIRTHGQLNKMVLRLGLDAEIPAEDTLGIEKKCGGLGRMILDWAAVPVRTFDGTLSFVDPPA